MEDIGPEMKPKDIDEYIAAFPKDVQEKLESIRQVIRESAPEARETISYGMPAFRLCGPLVYFAAFKNHIGFYPTSSGIDAFKEELSSFKQGRGSVQFPINQPIPLDLVRKIVMFRASENVDRKNKRTH